MPICISKPSAVVRCGTAITPALLISTSTRSVPAAKARTEARSAMRLRQANTTSAPARASARAATAPSPLLAPVTMNVRPL
ncbi:Uncharacterised protein [Mycobacteroides abscessus subsp. abscessus]|nr:Uncharacterised protein [Mycobacteroides abscessus subsp. abscessus]